MIRFGPALAFAALAVLPNLVHAEVQYDVTVPKEGDRIEVAMTFKTNAGPIELQMPNWSPGAYVLSKPARNVSAFTLIDSTGHSIPVEHPEVNTWKASAPKDGRFTARYTVPTRLDSGSIQYSGPSTYMYLVGRKEEACKLRLFLPEGWKVAVGLDQTGKLETEFRAKTYDVLADNPVTAGDFIDLHYTSHRKPITIVLRGAPRAEVDPKKVVAMCKAISDWEGSFFGGLPFNKYVWHFSVFKGADGGGGLEHLSSTQISLASGVGPVTARVCAHEFFHLWNVKRIRSKVLGPFDYTQLPKTGALYWLEGVTDYYSSVAMLRSGYLDQEAFLKDLVNNLNSVRSNPARLEVSPYDSSLRVGEANNGIGNSTGYKISYYNLGWLVGFCLDTELRKVTGGKSTLDDVERALWRTCRNDRPGFEEGAIEDLYVKFGGSRDYFRRVVKEPGELPIEDALFNVGFQLVTEKEKRPDYGFAMSGSPGSPNLSVTDVQPFATSSGLQKGDQIVEINGKPIAGASIRESITNAGQALGPVAVGLTSKLKVLRNGATVEVSVPSGEVEFSRARVKDSTYQTARQLTLRKALFSPSGR